MVYRSSRIWSIHVSDYGQSKSQIWVNRIPDFPEALNMTMREVLVSMGAARIRTPRSFGHHLFSIADFEAFSTIETTDFEAQSSLL